MTDSEGREPLGSVIQRRDMKFHQPHFRDHRWLETNGYSLTIPQAQIGAHLWNAFRTNLGVVESRIMVWSDPDPHAGVMNLEYLDDRHHIPMPPDQLDDFRLNNGLAVKMTVPLMEWDLRYDGAYDTVFDLHLRGLCPPLHISETGTEDAESGTIKLGHLDQMMMITGTVRLLGKDYSVEWPSWRDHSWSPRPEGAGRSGYAVDCRRTPTTGLSASRSRLRSRPRKGGTTSPTASSTTGTSWTVGRSCG